MTLPCSFVCCTPYPCTNMLDPKNSHKQQDCGLCTPWISTQIFTRYFLFVFKMSYSSTGCT